MATRDPVRVGEQVKLRALFTDDAGMPIEATSVTVDLFAPGLDPDIDTPTSTGLVPVYLGEGVFELTFTASAPEGSWTDVWTGDIVGITTSVSLSFTTIEGGTIEAYPLAGLNNNNVVEVILLGTIANTDGIELGEDYTFNFTTTYSPLYSSVRKVRLEVGALIRDIPDDTLNLSLLEASLEADELNFRKDPINASFFQHARREYVTCKAASILLTNIMAAGQLKSKTLDNFSVTYDTQSLHNLSNKLLDCSDKWAGQLAAGGGLNVLRRPQMVVKGDLDPDRPDMRRSIDEYDDSKIPAANTSYKYPGTRRSVRGFRKNRLW